MPQNGKRSANGRSGTKRSRTSRHSGIELGYALSSEEHAPNALVRNAARAEEVGFKFALISDHFHPWTDRQGSSPFVWSVVGAIAHATERLRLGTGVTCPLVRIHPAILAQAAATAAAMMPGRFFFGVGTGENLNEHILGDKWYPSDIRREMLREAVGIIRQLWQGGSQSEYGMFYTVENAQIYTLPDELPDVYVAAGGDLAATLAGEIGDGLILTSPDKETIRAFDAAGGKGKPRYGQLTVSYAKTETEARRLALEWWPIAAVKGELHQELPLPAHFEQASELLTEEHVSKEITCDPDPEAHMRAIEEYVSAGVTHVYVHQVGPDQASFFRFYENEILPRFQKAYA
jgi:G6PDH family F420-dependent oxidoreductase